MHFYCRQKAEAPSERAHCDASETSLVRIFLPLLLISSTSIVFTFQKWIHLCGAIWTFFFSFRRMRICFFFFFFLLTNPAIWLPGGVNTADQSTAVGL